MTITVTGASGKLGSLIVRQLLQKVEANDITLCVRDPKKALLYQELDVDIRQIDYDSPESLQQAFTHTSRLLFISSPHMDDTVRIRQHSHVVEAAKKANVEHIIYTSFAFPEKSDISLTHLHLATEHAIRTTGIPYTFLRNALYADFIAQLGLGVATRTGELITYPGIDGFNSVTREDLALAAANILTNDAHKNQTYELTASRPWHFADLVQALTEITGAPITHREDSRADNWLYRFLSRIDTTSTTNDLETLIEKPTVSLYEAVRQILTDKREDNTRTK
ncbi:NmrA family NAD(P)-binding protein [Brevibacillus reuszeri]|uniref:NmrA family NAD(P)-binding protein n=1 Tax=Brevibacillus reuszeri TaxID=54915 RepID=UPI003D1E49EE